MVTLTDTTRRAASHAGPTFAASLTVLTEGRGPLELRLAADSLRNLAATLERMAASRIDIPYGAPGYAEPHHATPGNPIPGV